MGGLRVLGRMGKERGIKTLIYIVCYSFHYFRL